MESQAPKVELKEIGLDVGLAVARHFYKTEYLHYGFWTPELSVEPANVLQAQENYANLLPVSNTHLTQTTTDQV